MNVKLSLSRKLLRTAAAFRPQIDERWEGPAWMGWGRRPLSLKSQNIARWLGWRFLCLEDGWIRSRGLGDDQRIYSLIVDDLGIYYDATAPSRLEAILSEGSFVHDRVLIDEAAEGLELLRKHRIAKYNHAPHLRTHEARKLFADARNERVLIVAQTAGDASLEYGSVAESTEEMILRAREEHPKASLYLKIHPDVLAGRKESDIDPRRLPRWCRLLEVDCNPYSLLEHMDYVYTKTSGMGMEALILGKKVSCSGMPFYAGWGLTEDRFRIERRGRRRTLEELFAAAYLLYPIYRDPVRNVACRFRDAVLAISGGYR